MKTIYASEDRGIDGGKKVKGRKHHIVVDITGNLLAVTVHAANIHDTKAEIEPTAMAFLHYPSIKRFCGDAGYRKSFEEDLLAELGLPVDISECVKPEFEVLPKRWVVERTFAWMGHSGRLSEDFEICAHSAEAMAKLSLIHTLLRRC